MALAFCTLLWRDREFWRSRYQERDKEAISLQKNLLDQMLLLKGYRKAGDDLEPKPTPRKAPVMDVDGLQLMHSRMQERVEVGTMTPSELAMLSHELATGSRSADSIDRILRDRDQQMWGGSVAEIE